MPELSGRKEKSPRCLSCGRSEEHTSELQSLRHLVCRLLLENAATTEIYTLSLHDALPILAERNASPVTHAGIERPERKKSALPFMWRFSIQPIPMTKAKRSEDRPVGKECRSRWSPVH